MRMDCPLPKGQPIPLILANRQGSPTSRPYVYEQTASTIETLSAEQLKNNRSNATISTTQTLPNAQTKRYQTPKVSALYKLNQNPNPTPQHRYTKNHRKKTMTYKQCEAKTKQNKPCKNGAMPYNRYCGAHTIIHPVQIKQLNN